ncbi:transglutaminase-like cysteine peptidase [Desulfosediminicola flagellatus]|uniref:transglutaminase-like cysteine peptidase n=1 Tax=Desulfosediminicola flagellatus TaxID=2569541 RepID=UPI0010AD1E87|nr:transglutaminase-like cysteine peptidase [Desulfosediminicola flagellatus]
MKQHNTYQHYCLIFSFFISINLFIIAICTSLSFAEKRFPVWDEQVFAEVEKRHGLKASERIRDLYDLIRNNLNKNEMEQLEIVNDYMNGLQWIADSNLWKQEDYWATPFETMTTFGGDCEDIAIAKYTALRLMGFNDDSMGFAYVITAKKERHIVMVYKSAPDKESLILDNLHPDVVTAKERKDLMAVYAFKNNGDLFVIKDEGNGNRSVLAKKENSTLQKWLTVKKRARENTASYLPFNGGKPLIPEWAEPPDLKAVRDE